MYSQKVCQNQRILRSYIYISWSSPPVRNAMNLQTFCFKDHQYESFFLFKDSLPCATYTLDLCILFKFIFLYLQVHSAPFLRISQVLLVPIFSYVYYHAEYFSCPRWCRWWAKARNLISIFNFSSQTPHLNYILLSNVYSFEFP